MLKIDQGEKKKLLLRMRLDGDAINRAQIDVVKITMDHTQSNRKILRSLATNTQSFQPAAVDIAKDTITLADHGLVDGDKFQLTTTGVLPAGLSLATDYYVVQSAKDSFKLSASLGGAAIDLTDQGSGVHSLPGLGLVGSGDEALGKYLLTIETWVSLALKKAASQTMTAYVSGASIGPEIMKKVAYSVE